jgi:hypothetical protein
MMYLAIAGASVDIDAHLDLCAQLSVAQTHTVPPAHPPPCNYILDDVACLKMDGQCTRMATKRNETKRNETKRTEDPRSAPPAAAPCPKPPAAAQCAASALADALHLQLYM